jgi:thiol-disulfide isomerase/thioredoxin
MKRGLIVAGAVALVVALTVVVIVAGGKGKHLLPPSANDVDVATPEMVASKAAGGVEDCPAPQTTNGGLPDITLHCLGGGRDVDLSTLKGPLLINLFQADCTPCRKEMPALEQFHQEHPDVPVLGIDGTDVMAPLALYQAIQRGVTYPMAADPDGELLKTSLRVNGYPYTYLLTADGRVTLLKSGGFESSGEIEDAVTSHGVAL